MSVKQRTNNGKQQASDQQMIDGFTKHAATLVTLLVSGNTVKTADLIAVFQARIKAIANAVAAYVAYQAAVKAAHDELSSTAALVSGSRQAIKVAFAGQIEALADFGLKPRKSPTPRTPQQKAAAAAKAKATRAARHTMSAKQKAQITGETAAAAAAASAAATPVASPAPAVTPAQGGAGAPKA